MHQPKEAEIVAFETSLDHGPSLILRERVDTDSYVRLVLDVQTCRTLIELLSGVPVDRPVIDWS